jgi:hypothetical protein
MSRALAAPPKRINVACPRPRTRRRMLRYASSSISQPGQLNALRRTIVTPAHRGRTADGEARATKPPRRLYRKRDPEDSPHRAGEQSSKPPRRESSYDNGRSRPAQRNTNHLRSRPGHESEGEVKILRPAVLSKRITTLADAGLIDDAVLLLQNAPVDAQNIVVWNTTIRLVMKAEKYKLAYSLYTDVSMPRQPLRTDLTFWDTFR